MRFIRNWKISVPVAGVVLAGLAWLAFGYFGIQTAFIDDEVSEAAPEFDAPAAAADPADTADPAVDTIEPEGPLDESPDVSEPTATSTVASTDTPIEVEAAESVATEEPETNATAEPVATDAPVETEPPATEPTESAVEAASVEPEIVTEASGAFAGTSSYDVSGEAVVLGNGTGQRFLRFEDFESSNGPDLNVYLFNPDDPNDFIDLGDLKGNIGEQNYELGAEIDLDRYSEVSIWCVRFGVGFGSADLVVA